MPLSDIVAAALSRPAGRLVEAPVRTIVNEVISDHGVPSPALVRALEERIAALERLVGAFEARLADAEAAAETLRAEVSALRAAPGRKPRAPGRSLP